MTKKNKIGSHFVGDEDWEFRPLRGAEARRDARPTIERRVHAFRDSFGNVDEPKGGYVFRIFQGVHAVSRRP
jgi:hypothetical protein